MWIRHRVFLKHFLQLNVCMCACLCARICVRVHACIRVVCGWVCVWYMCMCVKSYTNVTVIFQDKLKENKIGQMATGWPTHKVDKAKQKSQWAALSGTLFTSSTAGYAFQQRDPSFILEVALSCSSETSVNAQRAVFLWVCPHKRKELLSSAAHNTADPCSIRDGLSGTYRLPASYRDLADFHGQSAELLKAALHRKTGPRRRGGYTSRGGIIDMHSYVERHRGPGVQQAEPRSPRVLSSNILYWPKHVYEGCSEQTSQVPKTVAIYSNTWDASLRG